MEHFAKLAGIDKQTFKQAMGILEIVKAIMPKFEFRNLTMETENEGEKDFAAILFEPTPENKRRVTAIEELFTDILPPFISYEDFELEGCHYAAVLFEVPAKEGEN